MALFSTMLNISVFDAYHFIYPVIFIPIYAWLVIAVVVEIRKYENKATKLSVVDYIVLSFFFIGLVPTIILKHIGIWKTSWIVSESFLFSLIFFLLYILIVLKIIKSSSSRKNISIFLLTLLFIFICTSMKISVGFLLAAGVIYFNFRKNTRKIRFWIANLGFLVVFAISFKIFSEAAGGTEFQFFSFVRNFTPEKFVYFTFFLHYGFLLFFSLLVLWYQLSINRPIKNVILSKKILIEETFAVVCILALLPGLFLKIGGGSANYFSYFQELIAICLLLGFNIPDKLQNKFQFQSISLRNGVICCIALYLLILMTLYNSQRIYSFVKVIYSCDCATNTLLTNVQDIIEISKNNKAEYCIFLDENAEIWDFYKTEIKDTISYYRSKERNAIFFYPALTGIRLINGIYTDGVDIFTSNGAFLQEMEAGLYGITKNSVINNVDGKTILATKLDFDAAIEKANNNGYKYLIHFYNDKYQIINL